MDVNNILETNVTDDNILDVLNNQYLITLKNNNVFSQGVLTKTPLKYFFSEYSNPEIALQTVSAIRETKQEIDSKTNGLNELISKAITVNPATFNFELQESESVSLSEAITQLNETFATRGDVLQAIDEIYKTLWQNVDEILTECFQTSMYARQYTGSADGTNAERPVYTSIVFPKT